MKLTIESIRGWIEKKNFIPKLVSIILAVILWGYLTSSESGDVKFRLPVSYRNLDQTLTVSRLSNKHVMVRITGRKDDLANVNSKNVKVFVDLSAAKIGEYSSFPVKLEKIDLPEELEVFANPEEISLLVERKIFRNILITPRLSGEPDKGLILGKIKLNPEYVRISGPAGILSGIDRISTDYIFLNNRNASFKTVIKLEKINEDEIDYGISEVDVSVPLIPALNTAYTEIPVTVKNRVKGFIYKLGNDKVNVNVILQQNKGVDSLELSAYIDASEIPVMINDTADNGLYEKEAIVHVKSGVSDEDPVLSVRPERIKVIITRE